MTCDISGLPPCGPRYLNRGEQNLVLRRDEKVRNCFICSSKCFLSGAGYHIVIEREPRCDAERISAVIYSRIPDAILENSIGTELSFILPKEHTHRYRCKESLMTKNHF